MDNNDALRRLRFAAKLNDAAMLGMLEAAGMPVDGPILASWFLREEEAGFAKLPDKALLAILDGIISRERGPIAEAPLSGPGAPSKPHKGPVKAQRPVPLDNNLILRKLKIAYALKGEDMVAIMAKADTEVSVAQLSAFFRRRDQRNYRPCLDQFLRAFLTGLPRFLEKRP